MGKKKIVGTEKYNKQRELCLKEKLEVESKEKEGVLNEYIRIKNSITYKVGKVILYIPKKIAKITIKIKAKIHFLAILITYSIRFKSILSNDFIVSISICPGAVTSVPAAKVIGESNLEAITLV